MHTYCSVKSLGHLVLLGCLLGTIACSKKSPAPAKVTVTAAIAPAVIAAPTGGSYGGDGKLDPKDPKHGTRKLMGLDAPVYVDGAQVAVLRFGEMPALTPVTSDTGAEQYRLYDYLKGIGIAPETIKSIHLHGNGDKIGSIEGAELLKEKNRFTFAYVSKDTGAPVQRWSASGLKNEFVVHELRRVTVYVNKPAPAIDAARQCHLGPDGNCTDAIPYANGDVAKGTRIYLDGKMVGFVKRRQITDAMLVGPAMPDSSDNKYGLTRLVASLGIEPTSLKSVELTAGDDVVARAAGAQLSTLASATYFTLPKHNHGKVRMHVPADIQAKASDQVDGHATDRDGLVSAVLLYKNTVPADHDLVAISEDTDTSVLVAAVDDAHGHGGGGGRGEQ